MSIKAAECEKENSAEIRLSFYGHFQVSCPLSGQNLSLQIRTLFQLSTLDPPWRYSESDKAATSEMTTVGKARDAPLVEKSDMPCKEADLKVDTEFAGSMGVTPEPLSKDLEFVGSLPHPLYR
jgi:hypothetical protein